MGLDLATPCGQERLSQVEAGGQPLATDFATLGMIRSSPANRHWAWQVSTSAMRPPGRTTRASSRDRGAHLVRCQVDEHPLGAGTVAGVVGQVDRPNVTDVGPGRVGPAPRSAVHRTIASLGSMAWTRPPAPTSSAISTAATPVPHPASSTTAFRDQPEQRQALGSQRRGRLRRPVEVGDHVLGVTGRIDLSPRSRLLRSRHGRQRKTATETGISPRSRARVESDSAASAIGA